MSGQDVAGNTGYVTHGERTGLLERRDFTVSNLHWINGPPDESCNLTAKLRHGPEVTGCAIKPAGGGSLAVHLEKPDRGIAAGQFAVFYSGDVCLGAGSIDDLENL